LEGLDLAYSSVVGITDDGEGRGGRKEMASSSADGMDGRESEVDDRVGWTLLVESSNMIGTL
jgi:hypothetical protein